MSRERWLVVAVVVVTTAVVGAVLAAALRDPDSVPGTTSVSSGEVLASSSVVPADSPSTDPSPAPTGDPTASLAPTPIPTRRPIANGDGPQLYLAFLRRLDADRSTVATLNQALQAAAEAGDRPAARRASIDILDFADAEQDWLRDHPPAACFVDAHAAADTMLEAYAATADAFIAWADAGTGLDGLAAFGRALDAAGAAGDALTVLGRELEATACLA